MHVHNKCKVKNKFPANIVTNNEAVRQTLLSRGIRPEKLPPSEDVKKVERRLSSAEKKSLENLDKLENE